MESPSCINPLSGKITTSRILPGPYRGELFVIYALLSAISYTERYNRTFTSGMLRIGSGWISGISQPTVVVRSKHFNLVKAIRRLCISLTSSIKFYHLYGHQDKHTPEHLLPRYTQLNIIVDRTAQHEFGTAHEYSSFVANAIFLHEGLDFRNGRC